jgi:guanine deaminase
MMNQWMKIAIDEAQIGICQKHGGPFGAAIVHDGILVASAHNEVLKTSDPTAHAEITAIRKATKKLQTPHLSKCHLYTTCEPCPMCWGAIYWSRIKTIFYGASNTDAGRVGFIDDKLHKLFNVSPTELTITQIEHGPCNALFEKWASQDSVTLY